MTHPGTWWKEVRSGTWSGTRSGTWSSSWSSSWNEAFSRARTASWSDSWIAAWTARAARIWADEAGLRRAFWIKARRFAARLPFAEDLLAAYYCAFDRTTPPHVKAALVGALAYFVLPLDAIPDVVPVLGFTDDAAVLAAALRLVAAHIRPEHRETARQALEHGFGD